MDPVSHSASRITTEMLDRYLAGDASPLEVARIRMLLDRHPGAEAQIRDPLLYLGSAGQESGESPAWDRMAARIARDEEAPRHAQHPPVARRLTTRIGTPRGSRARLGRVLAIGAGLVAVIGIGFQMISRSATTTTADAVPPRQYVTAVGERTTVTLHDGTRITLAPQTTLTVPARFGPRDRTVTLRGQAYFEVTPASGAPFTVRTGTITTRVLGTAFDVSRYDDDREARIIVASGKVVAGTPHRASITLVQGMIGRISDSSSTISTVTDVESYQTWTTGTLDFRRTRLAEILTTVGHWYGVRFVLADSAIAEQRITTYLDAKDLHSVLATLEAVLDVTSTSRMMAQERIITLTPRASTRQATPPRHDFRRDPHLPVLTEVGR